MLSGAPPGRVVGSRMTGGVALRAPPPATFLHASGVQDKLRIDGRV
jgi:hypothetical protein